MRTLTLVVSMLGLAACGKSLPEPWSGFALPEAGLQRVDGFAEHLDLGYAAPGTGGNPGAAESLTRSLGGGFRDAFTAQGYKLVCEDALTVGGLPSFAATFEKPGGTLALEVAYRPDIQDRAADGRISVTADTRANALHRALLGRCRKAI